MLKWWQDKHPDIELQAALYSGFDPTDIGLKFRLPAPFIKGDPIGASSDGVRGPSAGEVVVVGRGGGTRMTNAQISMSHESQAATARRFISVDGGGGLGRDDAKSWGSAERQETPRFAGALHSSSFWFRSALSRY